MARLKSQYLRPIRHRRGDDRQRQRSPSATQEPSRRRQRSVAGIRSVAGQLFLLQVLVVLLLVVASVVTLLLMARSDRFQGARDRSLATASAFAHSPGLVAAMQGPHPTAVLQPLTEAARKQAGVRFIVVMNRDGIRYTHPLRWAIGKHFVGTIGPSLHGRVTVEEVTGGPLGHDVQAVVPVKDANGAVVGMVSAGLQVSQVSSAVGRQLPVMLGAGTAALGLATGGTALVSKRLRRQTHGLGPAEMTQMYEHHDAVLHAVREGVVIVGEDGHLLLINDEARRLLNLTEDVEGQPVAQLGLDPRIAELLVSGRVTTDEVIPVGNRLLAVNSRLPDQHGGSSGSVATLRDSTELLALAGKAEVARGRLRLMYEASLAIGTTLDVRRTAEELTEMAVPRLADFATVDLSEPVLRGEEPLTPVSEEAAVLCRVALAGTRTDHHLFPVDEPLTFSSLTSQAIGFGGQAVLVPDLAADSTWHTQDPERVQALLDDGFHSLIIVPLKARGVLMGIANFWRAGESDPFEEDDLSLAEELAARAAVCIDNARRFTRDHTLAVTLQRSLLPRGLPEQNALHTASRYLPAEAGVGGDWFDMIPLPGARVALVVGDVVGHGLHAAVTMARLRTAVLNFSALDMPPDELLSHLDGLVLRIDEEGAAAQSEPAVVGATCLYAIYDSTTGICTLARAGHPLPALVHPDGTVEHPELPAGPPLGLGGLPFETIDLHLAAGTSLVLYTDGLIEGTNRDIAAGLDLLSSTLAHPGRSPEETCDAALAALLPAHQNDDIALLVARTRIMAPDRIVGWDIPADFSAVAVARADVSRQLAEWGLEEAGFVTELILSELITNAIRYATEPIRVRLIFDSSLICEVSDASSTSPHLRQAVADDEGGRGLFLVAQLADRWGTRYTARGKVIWAAQCLPGTEV
ncbi:SpoIIE family protein phosphatase [Streptomyces sp. NPDC101152]|uniref:SpoIIE family protein phosphatase n=1 Tax=Streptomyces sp. NPDC101152 TaxID=3366116 RepID=UPI0038149DD0